MTTQISPHLKSLLSLFPSWRRKWIPNSIQIELRSALSFSFNFETNLNRSSLSCTNLKASLFINSSPLSLFLSPPLPLFSSLRAGPTGAISLPPGDEERSGIPRFLSLLGYEPRRATCSHRIALVRATNFAVRMSGVVDALARLRVLPLNGYKSLFSLSFWFSGFLPCLRSCVETNLALSLSFLFASVIWDLAEP